MLLPQLQLPCSLSEFPPLGPCGAAFARGFVRFYVNSHGMIYIYMTWHKIKPGWCAGNLWKSSYKIMARSIILRDLGINPHNSRETHNAPRNP